MQAWVTETNGKITRIDYIIGRQKSASIIHIDRTK